jgi:pimeloyl-ACP methyl ester carboxylesterase
MSDEHFLDRDGTRLYAVSTGTGRPVVLIHGGLATHLLWLRLAGHLADRYRLILPDLRGSGRSHHAGPLTWADLADDVAALIRHLGHDRAVVGGASFGAGVAVAVALRHPEVCEALLVLHPAYGGADLGLTPLQQQAMAAMDAAGSRAPAEGVAVLFPMFDALPAEMRDRARAVAATYDPASVAASTAFMASGAQPFASGADLAAIDVPALLVPGVDPYHPPEVAAVYRRHLRHVTERAADTAGLAGAIEAFLEYRRA